MKIIINELEDKTEYPGKNLGEVLDNIRVSKVLSGTYIDTLHLNGQPIDLESKTTRLTSLEEVKTLDIKIVAILDIINKNIENTQNYLEKLIHGIEKAAELFQLGDEHEANKFFVNVVDGIEWVSQTLNEILKALKADPNMVHFKAKSVQERQNKLVGVTSQILEAQKIKDWILVADLLQYELIPYYKEWLEIMPELKKMAQETMN